MPRKPSTDWRELIMDAVQDRVPKIITTGLRLDQPSNAVIRRAAKKRGMSPSAFMRRSSLAVALHDLGEEDRWGEVNAEEPGFTSYGKNMGQAPFRPAGHGFGKWRIVSMEKRYADD